MNGDPIVFVADAGSVSKRNFHWVCSNSMSESSESADQLAYDIVNQLNAGRFVALGFECPLFMPLPPTNEPNKLGKARSGECTKETGNRPFNAGAGASLIATGIQSLAWVLALVKSLRAETKACTSLEQFKSGMAELFVWEAFVSGSEKAEPRSHAGDARLAVIAFNKVIESGVCTSAINDESVLSLAGAAILRAGLSDDTALLQQPCLVLRPLPNEANNV